MGCDIHPAIEVREHPDQKEDTFSWTFVAVPDRSRNYEFFSLLAGVRGEHEPWVERRGIPLKVSWWTYSSDGEMGVVNGDHSASWFNLAEARTFTLPPTVDPYTDIQWGRWLATMMFYAALYKVPDDCVRVVFNFDS